MLVCRNMSALLGISMPLMWRGACDDPATRKTGELDAALFVVRWRRILWTRKRRYDQLSSRSCPTFLDLSLSP
ncbi:mitochondrial inner membrane protein OXA1-like [Musa troglodytarum]|uniref:Mitochondrial inner membrane protein OXA1-like n=1 Tax=Musa troglodytarum TaxID=320322 RepID=A0A9E7KYZ0_9LILI|nr:mitochondrial inner membrane protein OXA1-like [Musa troglodytarum]